MDSANSGYAEAKRHAAHACFVPPAPLDSAARAALCDSLKISLAAADTTAEDYPWLVRETRHACEEKRPPMGRGRPEGRHGGPRGGRHGR